jgi:hypothetical protein
MKHTTWFTLSRHEGENKPPEGGETDDGTKPPEKTLTQADVDRVVADRLARERQKFADYDDVKAKAARLDEIEAANATEAEKLAAKADAAEKLAAAATARAVKAEVKALSDSFADRDDAVLNLGDLSRFITDGDVDTDAIEAELGKVLERKPHLGKVAGARNPAPDQSQGRGGDNGPTDYRKASPEEFATELAKYGLRAKSHS